MALFFFQGLHYNFLPMQSILRFVTLLALLSCSAFTSIQKVSHQRPGKGEVDEENHYKKWLEDVSYIITDEEQAVFKGLNTPEERDEFIEQFWRRRDPAPETTDSEFREEHYRRLAYANDRFSIGGPGWKSDRGRVYIIHGQPDSITTHGQGEQYYRPRAEGSGVTSTFAYEVWHYKHLEGIGDDIDIEFVDKTMSGHYVLARDEMDKDATLWVPGLGLTLSEIYGLGNRGERIGTRTLANEASRRSADPLRLFTRNDDLFDRLRRYAKLQAPPSIKFKDLDALTDVRVYFNNLPFTTREDIIRVTPTDYLVPVTFYFRNNNFTFSQTGSTFEAKLNVYGRVESIRKQKVYSFDDSVVLTRTGPAGDNQTSLYQHNLPLRSGRYKIVAVVKDVNGGKIGTLEKGIYIPGEEVKSDLELSPIILADRVQPAKHGEFINNPFVLSTVKVYPSPSNKFKRGSPLGFYFEVYNVMADRQTVEPSLSMSLAISRNGQEIPMSFQNVERMLHRYADRFFAGSMLSTEPLEPGLYTLTVSVIDNIARKTARQSAAFEILDRDNLSSAEQPH